MQLKLTRDELVEAIGGYAREVIDAWTAETDIGLTAATVTFMAPAETVDRIKPPDTGDVEGKA